MIDECLLKTRKAVSGKPTERVHSNSGAKSTSHVFARENGQKLVRFVDHGHHRMVTIKRLQSSR